MPSNVQTHSSKSGQPDKITLHGDRILRWPEVQNRTGLCRSHVHGLAAKGKFPTPIKLGGGRASGWLESEVTAWIAERVAESRDHRGAAA